MAFLKLFSLLALIIYTTSFSVVINEQIGRVLLPCQFPAIYNFGDSNSDTGGISAAFMPILPPSGQNFFGKPAGRVSDGRLIIDFFAEHLQLPYLTAYLNSIGSDFRHGANFATGGSTIRRQNETIYQNGVSPFSLDMQIVQFGQFKARTYDLYNQAKRPSDRNKLPRPEDFSTALYTIDIGQNDLGVAFRTMNEQQLRATMPDIVNQLANAVQNLYQQGGRSFWIHNTGPIGCLPQSSLYIKKPNPGFLDRYGCIRWQNNMAIEFNKQLKARILKLRTQCPKAAITYVDVYTAKYRLISTSKNQGFADPLKICCGVHENDINVWCGQKSIVNGNEIYGGSCRSPSKYISWDGIHYTQAANHWVSDLILNGSLSDPPLPITQACYKTI